MPPLSAISDAGGWAVAVFMALSIIVAVIRGLLVPGPVNAREIARADRLEAEGVRLARRYRSMERELQRCRERERARKATRRVAG